MLRYSNVKNFFSYFQEEDAEKKGAESVQTL